MNNIIVDKELIDIYWYFGNYERSNPGEIFLYTEDGGSNSSVVQDDPSASGNPKS